MVEKEDAAGHWPGKARIAVVIGTRPEAIKMAPVIKALEASSQLSPLVISTGQHREMLTQVLSWFRIEPDVDLRVMQPDQTLSGLLAMSITRLDEVLREEAPDAVLVQGDTTTAFAAAMSAFHLEIPVGHVEAGLRTDNLRAPFPEEANRRLVSRIANWHFAPTERAMGVLKREGAPGRVFLTGNTVVDALISVAREADELPLDLSRDRMVLITGHRRENIGRRFQDAFEAIAALADRYPDVDFVYPVHMNPNVREHAHRVLAGRANVTLTEPVSYPSLIALMKRAYLILTDSGGIQEEAPSFGVPVLVMRETTERPEAVEAGVAKLVGTDRESIVANVTEWLDDTEKRRVISRIPNPFGDGHAADRIAGILTEDLRPAAVSNVAVG